MVCIEIHKYKYSVVMTTQPLFILVIDHGDSSDDVNGSGSLSIKWKYETDNGTGIQLGWGRGGGGGGGGEEEVNRCSIFSILAHVHS